MLDPFSAAVCRVLREKSRPSAEVAIQNPSRAKSCEQSVCTQTGSAFEPQMVCFQDRIAPTPQRESRSMQSSPCVVGTTTKRVADAFGASAGTSTSAIRMRPLGSSRGMERESLRGSAS